MKIIEKATTPDGVEIQLEDWSEHNTNAFPDLYGLQIGAYPIARNTSDSGWIRSGEKFRLTIAQNKYMNYSNEDVTADFVALKNGIKTIEDLADHYWNGQKDKHLLGIEREIKDGN